MPRIIVMADRAGERAPEKILLDEEVRSVHLSTDHAASQLVERLAWAIEDAEVTETARARRRAPSALRTAA